MQEDRNLFTDVNMAEMENVSGGEQSMGEFLMDAW